MFLQTYIIVFYSAVLCLAAIKYQVCPHAIMYNSIEPTPTDLAGAVVLCPGNVCLLVTFFYLEILRHLSNILLNPL